MPVAPGTPLDPAATRAKMLAAATDLFYACGVHAVGVEEIARLAGVSKLSLYRHFGSKDRLVAEVLSLRSDRVHAWLARSVEDVEEDSPRARILAMFDAICGWYGQSGFKGCAIVNGATDTRGDRGDIQTIARRHLERYERLFCAELTDMGADDPIGLARQLLILVEGATVIAAIEGSPDAGSYARCAAETLLDALHPEQGISTTSPSGGTQATK
jgi:AcrR family transcriptional regulator